MTVRSQTALLAFGVTLAVVLPAAHAQGLETVMQREVSVSRTLSGHAVVGMDRVPVEGVTVELCSPNWKTALASTKTDGHGYFSLEAPKSGSLLYLRLSAPGMDPYELRVRISKHGAEELNIRMTIAT